jgi:hypothetical protein
MSWESCPRRAIANELSSDKVANDLSYTPSWSKLFDGQYVPKT